MQCGAKCPSVNFPDQETYYQYSNTIPSISFHIYYIIARCTKYGRLMLNDKKMCRKCQHQICRTHSYPTLLKVPRLLGLYRTIKPDLLHCSGNFPSPRWIDYRRKRWTRRQTLTPAHKYMTQ